MRTATSLKYTTVKPYYMSTTEETKNVTVRMESKMVDRLDKKLIELKASDDIPMDFTRSDLIREMLIDAEKNPKLIKEYSKE